MITNSLGTNKCAVLCILYILL